MAAVRKSRTSKIHLFPHVAIIAVLFAANPSSPPAFAKNPFIIVTSTTSTQNSGLFNFILPKFTKKYGIDVHIVAVGTGQAIKLAKNGDADVLLVHHRESEEKFVKAGFGLERHEVMHNDFIIIGPAHDPAKISGNKDPAAALKKIAAAKLQFASRGDDSGTHKKERDLWKSAGIDPRTASGKWYRETGSGMGATLNTASSMNAYTITDRGTWLKFANKGTLKILIEDDKQLFNPYGVILVNPAKHPHVKAKAAGLFVNWLISEKGQAAIADYRLKGEQAFFPNSSGGS